MGQWSKMYMLLFDLLHIQAIMLVTCSGTARRERVRTVTSCLRTLQLPTYRCMTRTELCNETLFCMFYIILFHIINTKIMPSSNAFNRIVKQYVEQTDIQENCGTDGCRLCDVLKSAPTRLTVASFEWEEGNGAAGVCSEVQAFKMHIRSCNPHCVCVCMSHCFNISF